jgi:hypothetical protein
MHTRFRWENQKEQLGRPDINGIVLLKMIIEKEWDVNWIHMAQDGHH